MNPYEPPTEDSRLDDRSAQRVDQTSIVCVARFTNPEQAAVAKLALEAHGIRCALSNQSAIGMFWLMSDAIGGVEVLVTKTDESRALELLDQSSTSSADLIGEAWKTDPEEEPQAPESESLTDIPLSAREENAVRALRGAVLGILFAPLQIYVFYLLLFKIFASDEPLRPVYTRRACQAALINIPYMIMILFLIRWTIQGV